MDTLNANAAARPACGTCPHYLRTGLNAGECHALPPTGVMAVTPQGVATGGAWPQVGSANGGCLLHPRMAAYLGAPASAVGPAAANGRPVGLN